MNNKFETYIKLGFSELEIKEMTRKFPDTMNMSKRKIEEAYNNHLNLGLNEKQIHKFLLKHLRFWVWLLRQLKLSLRSIERYSLLSI